MRKVGRHYKHELSDMDLWDLETAKKYAGLMRELGFNVISLVKNVDSFRVEDIKADYYSVRFSDPQGLMIGQPVGEKIWTGFSLFWTIREIQWSRLTRAEREITNYVTMTPKVNGSKSSHIDLDKANKLISAGIENARVKQARVRDIISSMGRSGKLKPRKPRPAEESEEWADE